MPLSFLLSCLSFGPTGTYCHYGIDLARCAVRWFEHVPGSIHDRFGLLSDCLLCWLADALRTVKVGFEGPINFAVFPKICICQLLQATQRITRQRTAVCAGKLLRCTGQSKTIDVSLRTDKHRPPSMMRLGSAYSEGAKTCLALLLLSCSIVVRPSRKE